MRQARVCVDEQQYQEILQTVKAIFRKFNHKATAMYVNLHGKKDLIGWHILLSKDEQDADYFVLYETDLFPARAQIRLLRGEYQIQYTLEPNNVILFSQFRISNEEIDENEIQASENSAITVAQPISDTEAKGLQNFLVKCLA